jgi:AcrR family transcriptional regulator
MPTATPRDRMVTSAVRLLRERGYASTSLRAVVEDAEAPWGSLHHYFPGGKQQLVLEAIQFCDEHIRSVLRASFRSTSSPRKAIENFFDVALAGLEEGDLRLGCPIAATSLEHTADQRIRDACSCALREWRTIIADGLQARGVERQQARETADLVVSLYEGALVVARIDHDVRPMRVAAAAVAHTLAKSAD